jgi:hypothetical protein
MRSLSRILRRNMSDPSWDDIKILVYQRARGCCEYCRTSEENTGQTMQVDHIDPHGSDELDNLCLSCWNCNNHKRQATLILDPISNTKVALYNPRTQVWSEHFEWINGATQVRGLTPNGRVTIARLKMNRTAIIVARGRWVAGGYHPPETI